MYMCACTVHFKRLTIESNVPRTFKTRPMQVVTASFVPKKKPGEARAEAVPSQRKGCKSSQCLFVNTLWRRAASHQSSLRMHCSTVISKLIKS